MSKTTTEQDQDSNGPQLTIDGIDLSDDPRVSFEEMIEGREILYEDEDQIVLEIGQSFEHEELVDDMDIDFRELTQECQKLSRGGSTCRYILPIAKQD